MRITACRISNFKRVRDVEIKPDADRHLILIGGRNGAGKSSVLDALTTAFGGKRAAPADPVRHGADEADIDVELDGGALTIKRIIGADGEGKLEVREKGSLIRSPQARLDKLVGTRFLDPIAFLQLAAGDQRRRLLEMYDHDGQIAKLDERREAIYARRTDVGRDLKKAEGELARLKEVTVGMAIDVAALAAERAVLSEKQRAGDAHGMAVKQAEREAKEAKDRLDATTLNIGTLEQQLKDLRARAEKEREHAREAFARADKLKAELDEHAAQWAQLAPRGIEIDHELARAGEHNRAVFEAEANNKRRAAAAATVAQLEQQVEAQSDALAKIEKQKLEVLSAAKLPVEGLGIAADGITLNGVPFAQSSAAERLRVALALSMAVSPDLEDVWIRDGALLDDESLELLVRQAQELGKRPWIEVVGAREGAIVIHDGAVRDDKKPYPVEHANGGALNDYQRGKR
jgi:DNA repair exonuclease SbcCD ATPase subunit